MAGHESAVRLARWEIYVDAFTDILQAITQMVIFIGSRSALWLLVLPHVATNVLAFVVFQAGYRRDVAFFYQLALAFVLMTDGLLLLITSFAFYECVINNRESYSFALSFGTNVCTGTTFDMGVTDVILVGLILGSIMLQIRQLISVTKVGRSIDSQTQSLQMVVFETVIFLYVLVMLAVAQMYPLLVVEIIAALLFAFWAHTHFNHEEGEWVLLAAFGICLVLETLFVILDETFLCEHFSGWHAREYVFCQTSGPAAATAVCLACVVRGVILVVTSSIAPEPSHYKKA